MYDQRTLRLASRYWCWHPPEQPIGLAEETCDPIGTLESPDTPNGQWADLTAVRFSDGSIECTAATHDCIAARDTLSASAPDR